MTEFTVSAKLIADASGMKQGLGEGKTALEGLDRSAAETAKEQARLTSEQEKGKTTARELAVVTKELASSSRALVPAGQEASKALALGEKAAQRKAYAMRQLGIQLGDVSTSLSTGANPAIVFGQQIGQLALAAEGLGGRLGAVAGFLTGPWGAAVTGAVTVLGVMASGLLKSSDASDKAKASKDIHKMSIEDFTKAVDEENKALGRALLTSRETEKQALATAEAKLREAERRRKTTVEVLKEAEALAQLYVIEARRGPTSYTAGGGGAVQTVANAAASQLEEIRKQRVAAEANVNTALGGVGSARAALLRREADERSDPSKAAQGRYDRAVELATAELARIPVNARERAAAERRFVAATVKAAGILEADNQRLRDADKKPRKGKAPPSLGSQLDVDMGARILGAADRYQGMHERAAGGDLQALFKQANHNIDPKITAWCAAFVNAVLATEGVRGTGKLNARSFLGWGEETKAPVKGDVVVLRRGNNSDQGHVGFYAGEGKRGQVLVTGGNQGDRVSTQGFAKSDVLGYRRAPDASKAYTEEQRALTEATKEAERANAELDRTLQQLVGRYDPVAAAANDYADVLAKIAQLAPADPVLNPGGTGKISAAYATQMSLAAGTAAEAARRKREGLPDAETPGDYLTRKGEEASKYFDNMLDRAAEDRDAVYEASIEAAERWREASIDAAYAVANLLGGKAGGAFKNAFGLLEGLQSGDFRNAGKLGSIFTTLQNLGGGGVQNPDGSTSMGKWVAPLRRTLEDGLGKLGTSIQGLSSAMPAIGAGLALNQAVGKLFGSDQIKHGGLLTLLGGPLGLALGSSLRGTATITGVDGDPTTRGNSSSRKDAAVGMAGNVQGAISRIADALGGETGSFSGSIGIRKKDYVVDPTGQGRTKGSGVLKFKTEAEAQAALLRDAIADGAVVGLSAAMQRALGSNKDVDKAVREALKVQEIEELLEGLGGTLNKQFREFDTQAKERVRIAREYGFDVLKIEELNTKQRAELVEDILTSRVGSLKTLLSDISFGDLFEGSASEQRNKLLAEIATVRTDAEAGTDGAADKLATLSRQLIDLSRDAFGTAGGEYAADRQQAISAAEKVIQLENERVKAAQDATKETNTHLNENNNQNAQIIARLGSIEHLLRGGVGGGDSFEGVFGSVVRAVNLRQV